MTRECPVRFCERLGVQLPGATLPSYPALYQLLAPPDEPFAWDENSEAAFAPLDIYDTTIAQGLGLISANLDSAAEFRSKLNIARKPPEVRYFFFAGTRQVTPSCVYITKTTPRFRARSLDTPDGGGRNCSYLEFTCNRNPV
jgi:hypothetical protein